MPSSSRNSTRPSGNCRLNPKCCFDTHDLECPNKFYPPLLSTPTDFCAEVLAKGLPIPQCALAKPKKLVIEREPPPLAKPYTSRHLKNYQKWCYIWRQTYNTLTSKRNAETRPPIMSSGENHRLKKEDKELFDRTLHTYHLKGFYVKNAVWADSIRPKPQGDSKEIKEVITKRYLRDFPEMKRQRCPNFVRNEVSIPPRKHPTSKNT
ncbi:unnamed protein product [Orchesella dallaii]|uniref:Uncharacterized protein n=1 Tax=Orchesella dallaii TaxID=48710 RepID=A0ABP1S5V9_9HEXA